MPYDSGEKLEWTEKVQSSIWMPITQEITKDRYTSAFNYQDAEVIYSLQAGLLIFPHLDQGIHQINKDLDWHQ